jgi:hypothetical protein
MAGLVELVPVISGNTSLPLATFPDDFEWLADIGPMLEAYEAAISQPLTMLERMGYALWYQTLLDAQVIGTGGILDKAVVLIRNRADAKRDMLNPSAVILTEQGTPDWQALKGFSSNDSTGYLTTTTNPVLLAYPASQGIMALSVTDETNSGAALFGNENAAMSTGGSSNQSAAGRWGNLSANGNVDRKVTSAMGLTAVFRDLAHPGEVGLFRRHGRILTEPEVVYESIPEDGHTNAVFSLCRYFGAGLPWGTAHIGAAYWGKVQPTTRHLQALEVADTLLMRCCGVAGY